MSCFSEHPLFIDSFIASGDRGLSCFLGWVFMVYSPKAQIPSGAADCCRVQLLIAAGAHFLRVGRSRALRQPGRDKTRGWLDGQKESSIFFYSKTKQITLKTWWPYFIASQTLSEEHSALEFLGLTLTQWDALLLLMFTELFAQGAKMKTTRLANNRNWGGKGKGLPRRL